MTKLPHDVATRTIENINFALVPVAEYVELLDIKQRWDNGPGKLRIERYSRSLIDRNAALASFLSARLNKMEIEEARQACEAEFGSENTPSKSAIARYWGRLRETAAIEKVRAEQRAALAERKGQLLG